MTEPTAGTGSTGGPRVTLPGGSGMPLLGFGTWQARDDEAYQATRRALQTGYRHIDTAAAYGNEEQVGRAIADSGVAREDIFLTTKLPPDNAGRERETIEDSLAKLGLDAIDLWLVHWPPNKQATPSTWKQFQALRDEGLTREIGVSNYSTAQIDELIEATGEAPAVNQIKWGPALFDAARLAEHEQRRVVLEGYSPFLSTDLDDATLRSIADAHGVTPAQVVLRWHLEHGIVAIPKSVTPERIDANYDIFGFTLTPEQVETVDALG